ncbi:MAG: endo alpha-1,4 polygalactosaminidase [Halanaerobiales bacterium]|nr:endo alpha-1,4 polygalactosaminidase [Halanaerobiales bacterium]
MKKKIYFIVVICFVILFLYSITIQENNSLGRVENYRIYYRNIDKGILSDMQNLDLVIVEALYFTLQDVEKVKEKNGTILLGYLSVMEFGNWDYEIADQLNPSDYLYVDGEKVYNKKYNNYVADISQEHYQEILLDTLEKRILSKGMDGVFFDTIDWIDYYKNNEDVYKKLMVGYEELLIKITNRFPDLYIIQNRGFNTLYELRGTYVDGVVWENFDSSTIDTKKSVQDILFKLKRLKKKKGIAIFTISFKNEIANKTYTHKNKWKHLQTEESKRYVEW